MTATKILVFGLLLATGAAGPAAAQEANWQALDEEAKSRYRAGDYEGAMQSAEQALRTAEQTADVDPEALATSLSRMALLHQARGDAAWAERLYQESLALQEKTIGPEHRLVADTLTGLAWVHYGQRDYARAEPLFRRALAIREKTLGPEDRSVADALSSLAVLCMTTQRTDEARALEARAAHIWGLDQLYRLEPLDKEKDL